jgi:hypothetical protein
LAEDVKKTSKSKAPSLLPTATKLSKEECMDMKDVGEALADCLIPGEVDDIDRGDFNNPQLCAEYVNEIMRYLRAMEVNESSYSFKFDNAIELSRNN